MSTKDSAQRAHRLSHFYPMSWRERYGDEFEAHMEQEIEDTPYSLTRTLNIMLRGIFTRAKKATWRVIFMQPGSVRFKPGALFAITFVVAIAAVSFATQPADDHVWTATTLVGVLFALVIFGIIYDSHRIRTQGPAKRLSKDRLVPFVVIEISTLPFIFRSDIGHKTLVLYAVLTLDILLYVYKFGWLGRRRRSLDASSPAIRGNQKD
jgi:hypothetical protein